MCFAEFVRSLRIRKENGEMPVAAARMQDWQPGLSFRIEALGSDLAQRAGRRLGEVFTVYIKQEADRRAGGGPVLLESAMAKPLAECALDRECTPDADAG